MSSSKQFGLIITTSLVVGTMIGSGIFLLPVSLAEYGAFGFAGWLLSALGAMVLAFTFANLSRWHTGLGGPYYYSREGIGDFPGFFVAWGYWVSVWVGNAGIAIASASYLSLLFPILTTTPGAKPILAIAFVWLFTLINIRGVREAGVFQVFMTLFKTVPLILFAIVGSFFIDWQQVTAMPEVEGDLFNIILASTALWLWAFLGVEVATIPADNIKDPKRTIPKSIYLGVTIVAMVYVLCMLVIVGVMPNDQLKQSAGPFAEAAGMIWGGWASYIMIATAVFSTLGALNALILVGAQMPRAAAKDGLFYHKFADLNKQGAPAFGLIISACLTTVLILLNMSESTVGIFNFSILLSTTTILVPYVFCAAAAFRLQPDDEPKGKRLQQLIFALAFLFSMWALGGAGQEALYWGFLLMMFSVPVYVATKGNATHKQS